MDYHLTLLGEFSAVICPFEENVRLVGGPRLTYYLSLDSYDARLKIILRGGNMTSTSKHSYERLTEGRRSGESPYT